MTDQEEQPTQPQGMPHPGLYGEGELIGAKITREVQAGRERVPYGGVTPERLETIRGRDNSWGPAFEDEMEWKADPRNQAGWESIPFGERLAMMGMQKVAGRMGELGSQAAKTSEWQAIKAASDKMPILGLPVAIIGGGAKLAMGLFDSLAAETERQIGMFYQYKKAKESGTLDEFWGNLGATWKAAAFHYDINTTVGLNPFRVSELASPGDIVKAREWFAEGKTKEEVDQLLAEDLGLRYHRGKLADTWYHILFDPLNLIGSPIFKPVGKLASATKWAMVTRFDPNMVKVAENMLESTTIAHKFTQSKLLGVEETLRDLNKAAAIAENVGDVGELSRVEDLLKTLKVEHVDLLKKIEVEKAGIVNAQHAIDSFKEFGPLNQLTEKFMHFTNSYPLELAEELTAVGVKMEGATLWKPWTWFRMRPEAKAVEFFTRLRDHAKIITRVADSAEESTALLKSPFHALSHNKFGLSLYSYEGRTLLSGTRGFAVHADEFYEFAWKAPAELRKFLHQVAGAAGVSPEKVLRILEQSGPEELLKAVRHGVAQSAVSKEAANMRAAMVERLGANLDNVAELKKLDIFLTGKIPYNLDLYKIMLINRLGDHAMQQAIVQFGVETEKWFTKASNALKASEALAYLRLNPSYPLRNMFNNEMTLFARGVWANMDEASIMRFWDELGFSPERLQEGFGQAEIVAKTAYQNLQAAEYVGRKETIGLLNAVLKGDPKNILDRYSQWIKNVKLGKLDTGAWSATLEASASRRSYTKGFQQFLTSKWKPRFGFDDFAQHTEKYFPSMDPDQFGDEWLRVLHARIQDSVNPNQIDDILFAPPSASVTLAVDDVARAMGRTPDEVRDLLGEGLLRNLQSDIRAAGNDPDAILAAVDAAHKKIKGHLDTLYEADLNVMVERAAARIKAVNDPSAYLHLLSEQADELAGYTDGFVKRLEERTAYIRSRPKAEQGRLWDEFMKENDDYFRHVLGRSKARYEGMLQSGRRYGVHVPEEALKPMDNYIKAITDFHQSKMEIYKSMKGAKGIDWSRGKGLIDQEYQKLMRATRDYHRQMDETLYRVIDATRPELRRTMVAARETVHELRNVYQAEVRNFYRRLEATKSAEARKVLYHEFQEKRIWHMNRIHVAQKEGFLTLESGRPFGTHLSLDQDTHKIFNEYFRTDTLMQSEGGFEGLVRKNMDLGLSREKAMVAAQFEAQGAAQSFAGRVEDRITRMGISSQPMQNASLALRDAQKSGKSVIEALPEAMNKISDPQERAQWLAIVGREASDQKTRIAVRTQLKKIWQESPADDFLTDGLLHKGDYCILDDADELEFRLADAGYDPIGIEVDGQFKLLVPGMDSADAGRIARELGLDGFVYGNKGNVTLKSGVLNPFDDISVGDGNSIMRLANGDQVRFAQNVGETSRYWVAELDGPGGMVVLTRNLPRGTTLADPRAGKLFDTLSLEQKANVFSGGPDRLTWNIAGTAEGGYQVRVAVDKIYDAAKDTQSLLAKAKGNVSRMEQLIKEKGYIGYRSLDPARPNEVHIFEALKVEDAPSRLFQAEGAIPPASRSYGTVKWSSGYTSTQLRDDLLTHFKITEEEADAAIAICDARARVWSYNTGRPPDDWYASRIAGVQSGDEVTSAMLLQSKYSLRDVKKHGIISAQKAADLLGSEMPEHLKYAIDFIREQRQRLLAGQLTRRDVAKANLLQIVSQNGTEVTLEKFVQKMQSLGVEFNRADLNQYALLKGNTLYIRPEEAAAWWLMTDKGQAALNALDAGKLTYGKVKGIPFEIPLEFEDLLKVRSHWGTRKTLVSFLRQHPTSYSIDKLDDFVTNLNAIGRGMQDGTRTTEELGKLVESLSGVSDAKHGFTKHLLGWGDTPTLDAVEINYWLTGKSDVGELSTFGAKLAEFSKSSAAPKELKQYLINRVKGRFDELRAMGLGEGLEDEVFYHVMHHWLWDKAKGTETTHEMFYNTMRLAQEAGDTEPFIKGAVEFLDDSRAVITAFEKGDISTVMHELAHVFRRDLTGENLQTIEKWLKVKNGVWTVEAEEKFARGFEKYLRNGIAPTPELETIFNRFRDWLSEIYRTIKGGPIDVRFKDPVKKVFDNLLGSDMPVRPPDAPQVGIPITQLNNVMPDEASYIQGLDQLWWSDGSDMFARMGDNLVDQSRLRNVPLLQGLDDEGKAALRMYADRVKGQMNDTHLAAQRYGEMMRDAALLNYGRRTYFDHAAAHIFPFSFWTTHSMWNWLVWGVDAGPMVADFYRLKELATRMGRHDMPERFRGGVQTPLARLPFVPDYLGDIYVNPFRIGLPFDMWGDPWERAEGQGRTILSRAEGYLKQQAEANEISQMEYSLAIIEKGNNEHWVAAMEHAHSTSGGYDPMDQLSMLLSPHTPLMWAYHSATGNPEKIGPFLPATRTVKGISALLGVGPAGGINLEAPLRRTLGLPEFDQWEPYRIDRMLSNMAATGEFTLEEVRIAMATQQGPTYEEAKRRAGIEYGVSVLGSNLGIPLRAYPPGEERSRKLVDMMYEAYEREDQGMEGEVDRFFNEHPEVKARLGLFDTPEERLQKFLVDEMWDQWNNMKSLDRRTFTEIAGPEFENLFLDKETRNYDNISPETMQMWLVAMRNEGMLPGQTQRMPPPHISERAQVFYDERISMFPNYREEQEEYFKLKEGAARRSYLAQTPSLRKYWDWKWDWLKRNPSVAPYLVEEPPQYSSVQELRKYTAQEPNFTPMEWKQAMGAPLFRLIMDYVNGAPLGDVEEQALIEIAERYNTTPEDILTELGK